MNLKSICAVPVYRKILAIENVRDNKKSTQRPLYIAEGIWSLSKDQNIYLDPKLTKLDLNQNKIHIQIHLVILWYCSRVWTLVTLKVLYWDLLLYFLTLKAMLNKDIYFVSLWNVTIKPPAERCSLSSIICVQSIRELRNCGMCQHWNYHHTSRSSLLPAWVNIEFHSRRSSVLSSLFSSVPRTFNKGLVTSDLTSNSVPHQWPIFHNDSKVLPGAQRTVRNGRQIFRKTCTCQENICTLE